MKDPPPAKNQNYKKSCTMESFTATVIALMTVDIKAGTFKILTQYSESGFLTVSFGALKQRQSPRPSAILKSSQKAGEVILCIF